MAEQETTPKGQETNLESEREGYISQMKALLGEEPEPAQASATPEAETRTTATEEKPEPEEKPKAEPEAQKQEKDKKAKEAERLDKTWANANRRKSELDAREKDLAAREAEIDRLKEEAAQKATTAGMFTPEDFEAAAKSFEEAEDMKAAELARNRAKELRAETEAAKAKQARGKFESEMKKALALAKGERPDLNDPESPLAKTVTEVIANRPVFKTYPQGILDAVAVAELKLQADAAATVQKERDDLKARLAEIEKKLQPGGSTPGIPEAEMKPWEKLSQKERAEIIRQAAREADASGVGLGFFKT